MLAYTVTPRDDGRVEIAPGLRLMDGRLPLPQVRVNDDLLAEVGPNGLVGRTTPYRRLDPDAAKIDLGREVLPDVRALVLLDGRLMARPIYFSFIYGSDSDAGVERLAGINLRAGEDVGAQMVELVVLNPRAGVPVMVSGHGVQAIIRYDGLRLVAEPAKPNTNRAALAGEVLVPV